MIVEPALRDPGRALGPLEMQRGHAAVGGSHAPPALGSPSGAAGLTLARPDTAGPLDEPAKAEPMLPSERGREPFAFERIRIHAGPAAAVSAAVLRADAYSIGTDIVMGPKRAGLPDTGRLIAHEMVHQASGSGIERSIARAVTARYPEIVDRLTYGILDWAITDADARDVLSILAALSDTDLADTVTALDRDDLLERLLDNVSDEDRERFAVLLGRITRRRSVSHSASRVIDRLTYGFFDWAITDQDARDVLQVLLGLEPQELRTMVGRMVNEGVMDRFFDNLAQRDVRRFAAFIQRIRDIRAEFSALVSAQVAYLRSRPGGAGETVRDRVERTGYGGSRSTWADLDAPTRADWQRRARIAIAAVRASLRGTELAPILDRGELVFSPESAERLNAYAYVEGSNRLFFGRSWVQDAEEDVRNVWQSIAHELGGHEEFGDTWSWQIMQAAVASLTPEERREAFGAANSLYSAYGYLETEIYAELREEPHRIATSGGDRPEADVPDQLEKVKEAFGPVVGRQIALRLYYRSLDDPRVGPSARKILYEAIQRVFNLFPIAEPIQP